MRGILCGLKAYTFGVRKINLSGISPANYSRPGPNSVYVDRSRGANVQGILGAIGPFGQNWGWDDILVESRDFLIEENDSEYFRNLFHNRLSRCVNGFCKNPVFPQLRHVTDIRIDKRTRNTKTRTKAFERYHFQ